jgi:pimeloyl-ACP methyl ester carboxylesterase
MTIKPVPFTLHIPDAAIADLRERLGRTRFPDSAPGEAWAYGTEVSYLRELIEYWRTKFDWRAGEAALNAFPQFRAALEDVDLHYLHVRGVGPDPMPLLLLHGWPGSVFEFLDIIPRLTDPARFGGDARDAFTVVAPSLPGYGLSFQPGMKRFGVPEMADCVAALMTDVLGYKKFGAQGGEPTEEERSYLAELKRWLREETGYQAIQGTKPQTLAFALTDSPAGLAAWIVEKFRSWSDCNGAIENAIPRDRMLADIALYWFTGAIGSSFWPYYARLHGSAILPAGEKISVPTGYAQFPREMLKPPRRAAERVFTDIRRWSVMPKGGHFAALEQPELLAGEVQAFFRELR